MRGGLWRKARRDERWLGKKRNGDMGREELKMACNGREREREKER